jgi:ACS family hexuronate transporter-like MFS transporter
MLLSPKTIGRIRWIIAGLLFVETILNYLDLQTLAVLAPTLGKEMGLTDIQYATITQAFQISYLVAFLLGGWVIDKLGVRRGLALAMIWWSLAEAAHGFAHTGHELLLFRALLGFGYPGAYLAAAKAASEWYPPQERALVTGIYTAGATVGATVAPPLIAWLAIHYNWHAAFFITGFVGVFYALVWLMFYHRPETHPLLAEPERHYILAGRKDTAESAPPLLASLAFLFRSRYLWAIVLGRMIGDTPWAFYVYWIPKFLSSAQGLDLRAIGMVAWVPFLFSDLGSLGGGWLSGRLIRRGTEPVEARLRVMLGCAGIGLFCFTIYFAHSLAIIVGLLCVMMLATMAWMVNLSTLPVDVFPQEMVGTAVGLTTVGAVLGQTIFTFFIGRIVHAYSYGPLFILMSFLPPLAYLVIRFILRKTPVSSPRDNSSLLRG